MSPTQEQIHIPDRTKLEHRQTSQPAANDERPLVRIIDGRVMAVIEAWTPRDAVN